LKKALVVAATAALMVFGLGSAQASPSLTLCHGINVNIAGNEIINDSGCNEIPPAEEGDEG
jgi:hypothetical protein